MTSSTAAGSLAARFRPRRPRLSETLVLPAITIVVLIGLWQLTTSIGLGGVFKDISNPGDVAKSGWDMTTDGVLWPNARSSMIDFAVGFMLAVLAGVPLGMLMGWSKVLREILEPPLMAFNAMPKLALMPILILWLGIGIRSVVAVVFLDAMVPVLLNGMAGIRDVDHRLVQATRSFGAKGPKLFLLVLLPLATPALMTGIRLAISRGVSGVITAELFVSTVGIGHLLIFYGQSYIISPVIFLVLLVGVFAYLVNLVMERVERRFDSWRPPR